MSSSSRRNRGSSCAARIQVSKAQAAGVRIENDEAFFVVSESSRTRRPAARRARIFPPRGNFLRPPSHRGDPAGDGPRRQVERSSPMVQSCVVVPGEEPVQDLAAVLPGVSARASCHCESVVEHAESVRRGGRGCRTSSTPAAGALAGRGAEAVDAEAPRQLAEPGSNRRIVPQLVQMLVPRTRTTTWKTSSAASDSGRRNA